MAKGIAILLLIAFAAPSLAQKRAAQGKRAPRVGPAPKAHYNSTAKDTAPFQCETLRNHPYPAMQSLCNQIESNHIQSEARRAGRPGPSSSVIDLPSLGSADGKRLGVVCLAAKPCERSRMDGNKSGEEMDGRDVVVVRQ